MNSDTSTSFFAGENITDERGDADKSFIDFYSVETQLDGEILTAIIWLDDLPETLPFNQSHVLDDAREYSWSIAINVDAENTTGGSSASLTGVDYELSASSFKSQGEELIETSIFDTTQVQVNTWKFDSSNNNFAYFENADIQADIASNYILLTGRIPNISEKSIIAVETSYYPETTDNIVDDTDTNDISDSTDNIDTTDGTDDSIDNTSTTDETNNTGDDTTNNVITDGRFSVGQTVTDPLGDVEHSFLDIHQIETKLEGERLTVTLSLDDIPETLTSNFDFSKVESDDTTTRWLDYLWTIGIDTDNNISTGGDSYGSSGYDYVIHIDHETPTENASNINTIYTEEFSVHDDIDLFVGKFNPNDGVYSSFATPESLIIDTNANTITVSAIIPNISTESKLSVRASHFTGNNTFEDNLVNVSDNTNDDNTNDDNTNETQVTNIVYIVDTSGSMENLNFNGNIEDKNNDGFANELLDVAIAAGEQVNQALINKNVSVSSSSIIRLNDRSKTNINDSDITTTNSLANIHSSFSSLQYGSSINIESALERLNQQLSSNDNNHVIIISDGVFQTNETISQLAIQLKQTVQANIHAYGVGNSENLSQLDILDDGTLNNSVSLFDFSQTANSISELF